MKSPALFILLIGIALSFLKIKDIISVHIGWILICFAISFVLFYLSIHKKNKENNTPKPVFVTNQNSYGF